MESWIVTSIATFITGMLSYFLKQTMTRVEDVENGVQEIKETFVKEATFEKDFDKLEKEIVQIREDYTPKKDHEKAYDEVRKDVREMKENFLRKDDFLREITKIDQKMDKIQDLLLKGR